MKVSSQNDSDLLFRRLERSAFLIVRHPNYSGKDEAIRHSREDIEQRYREERLTDEQKARLLAILDEAVEA